MREVMNNQAQLQEFDREMAATRKVLERIPEEKLGWRPHEKSGSMAQLAQHLVNLAGFPVQIVEQASLDIAPAGAPASPKPLPASRQEILTKFDANVASSRSAITTLTAELLAESWTILSGGKILISLPRGGMLRTMAMNHSIHHRAQLGVYLRLNDVAVPAIYGPSADENFG